MSIEVSLRKKKFFRSFNPAQQQIIQKAERALELHFSKEYISYLTKYGYLIYDSHELTGICKAKRLNIVDVTLEERTCNPMIPMDWYVVEQANIDGIVIWQNAKGEIFQTMPNATPMKLCNSLAEYIERY